MLQQRQKVLARTPSTRDPMRHRQLQYCQKNPSLALGGLGSWGFLILETKTRLVDQGIQWLPNDLSSGRCSKLQFQPAVSSASEKSL
jgi:hypothetical protein